MVHFVTVGLIQAFRGAKVIVALSLAFLQTKLGQWNSMFHIIKVYIWQKNKMPMNFANGTACFKECKQLFEYQHLLLLRDIWWSKF
jgi:hypothetical protein